jgi:hypothetical protein
MHSKRAASRSAGPKRRSPRRKHGWSWALFGIVLVNLLLTELIAQDVLAWSLPAHADSTGELLMLGYNLISVIALLGFLAHETSKVYAFLIRASRIINDSESRSPEKSSTGLSPQESTVET